MEKKANIFSDTFENITNENLSEFLGEPVSAEDADLKMFDAIERENIDFYLSEGMTENAARSKAAERKKFAMMNNGYGKKS